MPVDDTQTVRVTNFIRFTADDYRTSAQACRAAAVQAEKDAEAQTNPQMLDLFIGVAKRFRELAEKHELAARVL